MRRMQALLLFMFAATAVLAFDRSDSIFGASVAKRLFGLPLVERPTENASCNPSGVIAGTLRNDGQGWYALNDDSHTPINIASVETGLHSIRVRFAINGRNVRTLIASPDETLAAAGFIIGASVGLNDAQISKSRAGLISVHTVSPAVVDTDSYPWSNIWIYGIVDGEC